MARWLNDQTARTVCERSWVRVPVGPGAFSSPITVMLNFLCFFVLFIAVKTESKLNLHHMGIFFIII